MTFVYDKCVFQGKVEMDIGAAWAFIMSSEATGAFNLSSRAAPELP